MHISFRQLSHLITVLSTTGLLLPTQPQAETSRPGEAIYRKHCASCHKDTQLTATSLGNAEAWATPIAAGQAALTARSWLGSGKMPPKGGAPSLSIRQFGSAVAFMARSAGADWQDPSQSPEVLSAIRREIRLQESPKRDAVPPSDGGLSGEAVYAKICHYCHQAGIAGAPPKGNRARWKPLIQEGQALLTAQAWNGVRAMPPRGGSQDLSLEEFGRAVAWMANTAGANWPDPSTEPSLLKRIQREIDRERTQSHATPG